MTPAELKHYLTHNATTNGLTNMAANGIICWLLIKDKGVVTWWGASNFGGDLLATGFILPFIVALIVIPLQRSKVRKGKVAGIGSDAVPATFRRWLAMPSNLWARAAIFGLVGMLLVAGPTLVLLAAVGVAEFSPLSYAIFKGVWAGILAALLVLPMIIVALHDGLPQASTSPELAAKKS